MGSWPKVIPGVYCLFIWNHLSQPKIMPRLHMLRFKVLQYYKKSTLSFTKRNSCNFHFHDIGHIDDIRILYFLYR